jgi:beta-aspartyl-peptidase (threonine type)
MTGRPDRGLFGLASTPVLTGILAATLAGTIAVGGCAGGPNPSSAGTGDVAIVIHGGAGTIRRGDLTPELEAAYRSALEEALTAGHLVLRQGGSSLDGVVAAIRVMEDSPLFNAGKGAVFTSEGTNELDAAIMDGKTLMAGAVAGVKRVRSPVTLARAVMEQSPHVMMSGAGAEIFAAEQGIELVDPSYFFTERRWEALQRAKAEEAGAQVTALLPDDRKFGTVGAVALDSHGNLAAATSTGGMTNKRFGRIGDAPIIGAGTYADNRSCAVSATGHGEYFIRATVAHDICARMKYGGRTLQEAAHEVVMKELVELGGEGGIIALDRKGNIAMPFNSEGMYRGSIDKAGTMTIQIYHD